MGITSIFNRLWTRWELKPKRSIWWHTVIWRNGHSGTIGVLEFGKMGAAWPSHAYSFDGYWIAEPCSFVSVVLEIRWILSAGLQYKYTYLLEKYMGTVRLIFAGLWMASNCHLGEQITPVLENKVLNRKSKTIKVILWHYTFIALYSV